MKTYDGIEMSYDQFEAFTKTIGKTSSLATTIRSLTVAKDESYDSDIDGHYMKLFSHPSFKRLVKESLTTCSFYPLKQFCVLVKFSEITTLTTVDLTLYLDFDRIDFSKYLRLNPGLTSLTLTIYANGGGLDNPSVKHQKYFLSGLLKLSTLTSLTLRGPDFSPELIVNYLTTSFKQHLPLLTSLVLEPENKFDVEGLFPPAQGDPKQLVDYLKSTPLVSFGFKLYEKCYQNTLHKYLFGPTCSIPSLSLAIDCTRLPVIPRRLKCLSIFVYEPFWSQCNKLVIEPTAEQLDQFNQVDKLIIDMDFRLTYISHSALQVIYDIIAHNTGTKSMVIDGISCGCIARSIIPAINSNRSLQSLHVTDPSDYNDGAKNVLSDQVSHLVLGDKFNRKVEAKDFPNSLMYLRFGFTYNQPITVDSLPQTITHLVLSYMFDSSLTPGALPSTLTHIIFDHWFDQPIDGILPPTLTKLRFGTYFNQPISIGALPQSIVSLSFGESFNEPLAIGSLPSSIRKLKFGQFFGHVLEPGVLPQSLTKLSIGQCYNQIILPGSLPRSVTRLKFVRMTELPHLPPWLTHIHFGTIFDVAISPGYLPATLTHLKFGRFYNKPIIANALPDSLLSLKFDEGYYKSIRPGTLPPVLTSLSLGTGFDVILPNTLPSTLQSLDLGSYNHPLLPGVLPTSLTSLKLRSAKRLAITPGSFPSSLQYLSFISAPNNINPLSLQSLPRHLEHLTVSQDFSQLILYRELIPSLLTFTIIVNRFDPPPMTQLSQVITPLLLLSVTVHLCPLNKPIRFQTLRLVDNNWLMSIRHANIQFLPLDNLSSHLQHCIKYNHKCSVDASLEPTTIVEYLWQSEYKVT
eukprot:gene11222-13082_t